MKRAKRAYIARQYFEKMGKSFREMNRVLKPRGKMIFVAGANTIRGVHIPTSRFLEEIAIQSGFKRICGSPTKSGTIGSSSLVTLQGRESTLTT